MVEDSNYQPSSELSNSGDDNSNSIFNDLDHHNKRKRKPYAQHACENCRRRKIRCVNDGDGLPCSRCKNSGIECYYAPRRTRGKRRRENGKNSSDDSTSQSGSYTAPSTTSSSSSSSGQELKRSKYSIQNLHSDESSSSSYMQETSTGSEFDDSGFHHHHHHHHHYHHHSRHPMDRQGKQTMHHTIRRDIINSEANISPSSDNPSVYQPSFHSSHHYIKQSAPPIQNTPQGTDIELMDMNEKSKQNTSQIVEPERHDFVSRSTTPSSSHSVGNIGGNQQSSTMVTRHPILMQKRHRRHDDQDQNKSQTPHGDTVHHTNRDTVHIKLSNNHAPLTDNRLSLTRDLGSIVSPPTSSANANGGSDSSSSSENSNISQDARLGSVDSQNDRMSDRLNAIRSQVEDKRRLIDDDRREIISREAHIQQAQQEIQVLLRKASDLEKDMIDTDSD